MREGNPVQNTWLIQNKPNQLIFLFLHTARQEVDSGWLLIFETFYDRTTLLIYSKYTRLNKAFLLQAMFYSGGLRKFYSSAMDIAQDAL